MGAAIRLIVEGGYPALTMDHIAERASVSKAALYRRWPNKADLATAVVAGMEEDCEAVSHDPSDDPFTALAAELTDFQRGVSRPGRLSLVGTMLQDATEADVLARYRSRVIAPRRRRLRAILERAQRSGMIDADADLEVAVTMCTGCWYGRALAGTPPPSRWAERTTALVWRAVGGHLPVTRSPRRGP